MRMRRLQKKHSLIVICTERTIDVLKDEGRAVLKVNVDVEKVRRSLLGHLTTKGDSPHEYSQ